MKNLVELKERALEETKKQKYEVLQYVDFIKNLITQNDFLLADDNTWCALCFEIFTTVDNKPFSNVVKFSKFDFETRGTSTESRNKNTCWRNRAITKSVNILYSVGKDELLDRFIEYLVTTALPCYLRKTMVPSFKF